MENFEILENIDMTIDELAYQLTAYEKWGVIDYVQGLIDLVFNSYMEDAEDYDIIAKYNEYLEANNYYDDMWQANDEEFFSVYFSDPMEAVRASFYGDYRYMDDYVKFNAYGNLESAETWQVLKQIKEDSDFAKWCIYNDEAFDELMDGDNMQAIKNEALKLVAQGY